MSKEKLKGALGNFWEDEKTFLEVLPILAAQGLSQAIGKFRSSEAPPELYEFEPTKAAESRENTDKVYPAAA